MSTTAEVKPDEAVRKEMLPKYVFRGFNGSILGLHRTYAALSQPCCGELSCRSYTIIQ